MPAGRPLKFKTPEELEQKINGYFDSCYAEVFARDKKGNLLLDYEGKPYKERQQVKPFTMSGLAVALDCDRMTLVNYSEREEYFSTIMRARRRCEEYAAEQLFVGNDRGAKFSLSNNYEGWKEKQEHEITGHLKTTSELENLSDDDLLKLSEILSRAKVDS